MNAHATVGMLHRQGFLSLFFTSRCTGEELIYAEAMNSLFPIYNPPEN